MRSVGTRSEEESWWLYEPLLLVLKMESNSIVYVHSHYLLGVPRVVIFKVYT